MSEHKEAVNVVDAYLASLERLREEAQEGFDKAVLTLSGGALGVSFVFVKDIVGNRPLSFTGLLLAAWMAWAASCAATLTSYFTSARTMGHAIKQIHKEQRTGEQQNIDGFWNAATTTCNSIAGVGFVVGVVLMALFAYNTL